MYYREHETAVFERVMRESLGEVSGQIH
jgi:hypothetical protein